MDLKRYTDNHTVKFLKFVVGLRKPETSVSAVERTLLAGLARGRHCVVEVGVFEGATSQVFCGEMSPQGTLYLVDPFFPEVRLERLLNVSFPFWIATRSIRPWRRRIQFVREPSHLAAQRIPLDGKADLIFIDARHDYDSVLQDFRSWAPRLGPGAPMAFHDSRVCVARPDLSPSDGPVRLIHEIVRGDHGPWEVIGQADSVTVIRRFGDLA
jgi:hypothetical protein